MFRTFSKIDTIYFIFLDNKIYQIITIKINTMKLFKNSIKGLAFTILTVSLLFALSSCGSKKSSEKQLEEFVNYYNHERYHESINNLTPADVYAGRTEIVLNEREEIKQKTMKMRRFKNLKNHEVEMVCN